MIHVSNSMNRDFENAFSHLTGTLKFFIAEIKNNFGCERNGQRILKTDRWKIDKCYN
uniref:Uncharacterized protein n=1 Tax=Anguilla anguilla TaxID=7936 RepID=A0A0E9S100_ANGAN